jgi:hypothetical protein
MASQKPSKELPKKMPFDPRDIPDIFLRMYDIANALASREGLVWIQAKYRQDVIDRMGKRKPVGTADVEDEPLLSTQLLDFVNSRREEYMQRMTQLLKLYAESGRNRKEEHTDK